MKYVKILGRVWQWVWVPKGVGLIVRKGRGDDPDQRFAKSDSGLTESPKLKGKRIFIREHLPMKKELDTTLHECLHAADWSKDEEWVEDTAHDITRILWRLGWRKVSDDDDTEE
jgi:hypothetical protein